MKDKTAKNPVGTNGQALVEMALILPILLFLTFAFIEFGRYLFIKNTATNGARQGARVALHLHRPRAGFRRGVVLRARPAGRRPTGVGLAGVGQVPVKYLANCFCLIVPVLAINVLLMKRLPRACQEVCLALSAAFLTFHNAHAWMVYSHAQKTV